MKAEIKQQWQSQEDFITQNIDEFTTQVWNCALLNNLFWGVWSISLLKPESYAEEGIFNYDFAMSRIAMYEKNLEVIKTL